MDNSEILEKLNEVIKMNSDLLKKNEEQEKEITHLKNSNIDQQVEIGCNLLMGTTLESTSGDISIDIKFREIVTLSDGDIRVLLKNSKIRNLFTNCLIFFVDDSFYKYFGIKKRIDLSDEKIISVINTNNVDVITEYFNDCTSNKFEYSVMHTLFYKIVDMNMSNKFGNMSYETRRIVEKYFNMEISMASRLYGDIKKLG